MERESLIKIEEAALNAWPAPRQMVYDGWLLRFTGGPSKRVNSVNILYSSTKPLAEKISTCESIYASQGQPCLFRVTKLFSTPELLGALADAGYQAFDTTLVLGRELELSHVNQPDVTVLDLPETDWFRFREQFIQASPVDREIHQSILSGIVPEMVLMGLYADGKPAACGMGVVEDSLLGFFSIHTAASWRRKGFGSLMMNALMDWGMARGASYGYLQVEGDNRAALAMYRKLGYEVYYRYEYYGKGWGDQELGG